jgi:molybdenum cofactor cytidylyltransferase
MDAIDSGIIILAAGESSRLGQAKQLLKFRGKTLIKIAVETALQTKCQNIVVVLGANSELIQNEINDYPITIIANNDWQSGMASSIRAGLNSLLSDNAELNSIIIMLGDQPLIQSAQIELLIKEFNRTKKHIIAAEYKNTVGVPALFSNDLFDELKSLSGDKGARMLIKRHFEKVQRVAIPEAEFDVDTFEDFQKLKDFE